MFDEYLRSAPSASGEAFRPSTRATTTTGTSTASRAPTACATFLASRGIELPEGSPDDPPDAETVAGLGNRKNELVLRADRRAGRRGVRGLGALRAGGARRRAAPRRRLVERQRRAGARARPGSTTCSRCASTAHVAEREACAASRRPTRSSPAPSARRRARRRRPCSRTRSPGVEAGRAGDFGFVVGVDRVGQAEALREHGADVVVEDLAELLDA